MGTSMWVRIMRRAVENPGVWQRSHPFKTKLQTELQCSYIAHDKLLLRETLESRVLMGKVGTWYFTQGIANVDIHDWQHFVWIKFVPENRRVVGDKLPEEAYRIDMRGPRIRRLTERDIRTKRSDGDG